MDERKRRPHELFGWAQPSHYNLPSCLPLQVPVSGASHQRYKPSGRLSVSNRSGEVVKWKRYPQVSSRRHLDLVTKAKNDEATTLYFHTQKLSKQTLNTSLAPMDQLQEENSFEPLGRDLAINAFPRLLFHLPGSEAHMAYWSRARYHAKQPQLVPSSGLQPRPGNTIPCYHMPSLPVLIPNDTPKWVAPRPDQHLQQTGQTFRLLGESFCCRRDGAEQGAC